jgi:hypothetical protein
MIKNFNGKEGRKVLTPGYYENVLLVLFHECRKSTVLLAAGKYL